MSVPRNITEEERTLKTLFLLEDGEDFNYQLLCLVDTIFYLNNQQTNCVKGQITKIVHKQWSIRNSFDTHNHILFVHKIKQQIRDRSGYEKLNTHI